MPVPPPVPVPVAARQLHAARPGPGVCAFARGIAEVLILAPVRDWQEAELTVPEGLRGLWRCVFTGDQHDSGERAAVIDLLSEHCGVALLERA